MFEFLQEMEAWHWGVAAAIFLILEMLVSGIFMMWMGIAAAVVALISLIFPSTLWYWQAIIWCVISIASVYGWRTYRKLNPKETDDPGLNKRGQSNIGKRVSLIQPIVAGRTRVKIGDGTWSAETTDDLSEGDEAIVIDVRDSTLIIEKV